MTPLPRFTPRRRLAGFFSILVATALGAACSGDEKKKAMPAAGGSAGQAGSGNSGSGGKAAGGSGGKAAGGSGGQVEGGAGGDTGDAGQAGEGQAGDAGAAGAGPTEPWAIKAPMPAGVRRSASSAVVGNELYVIGGASNLMDVGTRLEIFDTLGGTWSAGADKLTPQRAGVGAIGDFIYVIGHLTGVEVYSTVADSWDDCDGAGCASIPTQRTVTSSLALGGKIYVIGGFLNGTFFDTVEAYDPVADEWSNCGGPCAPMPTARSVAASAEVAGKIYVIGGTNGVVSLDTVEEFDPVANSWTNCGGTCTALPTPRSNTTAAAVGGKIYVFGGINSTAGLDVVEEFDPATNTWTNCGGTCTAMPTARLAATAATAGDRIYVVGGDNDPTSGGDGDLDVVEEYTPAFDND